MGVSTTGFVEFVAGSMVVGSSGSIVSSRGAFTLMVETIGTVELSRQDFNRRVVDVT